MPRGCEGGRLAFSPDLISQAFAVAGSSLIKGGARHNANDDGENRQMGFYGPLDLAKETAACREAGANRAARGAADEPGPRFRS